MAIVEYKTISQEKAGYSGWANADAELNDLLKKGWQVHSFSYSPSQAIRSVLLMKVG